MVKGGKRRCASQWMQYACERREKISETKTHIFLKPVDVTAAAAEKREW